MTDLRRLQQDIVTERRARGFTTDPLRLLALLVEEVGEVARELKGGWSVNYGEPSPDRMADELADTLVLVVALADAHGIDLDAAVHAKFFDADGRRPWPSAGPG